MVFVRPQFGCAFSRSAFSGSYECIAYGGPLGSVAKRWLPAKLGDEEEHDSVAESPSVRSDRHLGAIRENSKLS